MLVGGYFFFIHDGVALVAWIFCIEHHRGGGGLMAEKRQEDSNDTKRYPANQTTPRLLYINCDLLYYTSAYQLDHGVVASHSK